MEKGAVNSKLVGHSTEIIQQRKIKGPLLTNIYIFQSFRYLKVSLVPSVSPSNWSFTSKAIIADSGECPVVIADNFPVAVPKAKLSTKTLQVTILAITTRHSHLSAIIALLVKKQLEEDTHGTQISKYWMSSRESKKLLMIYHREFFCFPQGK